MSIGLLDLAPVARTVQVDGQAVNVYGVSAEGIAYLLQRYPDLLGLFAGDVTLDSALASKIGPQAIASLIAVGCGYAGEQMTKAEARAAKLGVEVQLNILEAVMDQTVPGGIAPFVERLGSWMESAMRAVKAPGADATPVPSTT